MYRVGQEEIDAFAKALLSRDFFKFNSSGHEVLRFEEEWGKEIGVPYAILMTSGFAALTSALIGMGIGPGDEVIVPGYTYIASALAVLATGAVPVIAEIDGTMTLDPADMERKISRATKAVMPVHIQGFPSNMDEIVRRAKKHGVRVLEDACQADGGTYRGRKLGSLGDAGAFSFNFYKLITSGEGGAVATADREIYERALIYHDAGGVSFFGNQLEGMSQQVFGGSEFRVSDLTGAVLRAQLRRLPQILGDLRKNRNALAERVELAGKMSLVPSNDREGDCGTTLALRFGTAEECRACADRCAEKGLSLTIPINTGKHVYTNWTQVMEKRGAMHPAMDPYRMEANRGLRTDYAPDMCPATLDYLRRTAYVWISPDWTEEKVEETAAVLNA